MNRKNKSSRRTDAEAREFARSLNAPILGAIENPPVGFSSRLQFTQTDLPARVRAIDWFANVGRPTDFTLTMPVEFLSSWQAAAEHSAKPEWENVELEAQNQLTLWLHQNARDRFRQWNELVQLHKQATINPLVESRIAPLERGLGIPHTLAPSIEWDILGALMENSFLDLNHPALFFLEIFIVYEGGHFPCGWDGDWPDGRLIVY